MCLLASLTLMLLWSVPASADSSSEEGAPIVTDQRHNQPATTAEKSKANPEPELHATNAPAPPRSLFRPDMGPLTVLLDEDKDLRFPTTTDKWIDVDLSEQKVIAFEGLKPVRSFVISSGLPDTPTVTGEFRIRAKVRSQTMSGGDPEKGDYYNLPNVEWVQYFYEAYSFHGTYWHNNFGRPMSHGCINMTNEDAKWLFDWTGPEWNGEEWQKVYPPEEGTLVVVHD
jgi:lipoprotein-anchoring transpeptidase ErfK/SrfK